MARADDHAREPHRRRARSQQRLVRQRALVRRPVRDLLQCRGPTSPIRTTLPPLPTAAASTSATGSPTRLEQIDPASRRRTAEVHLQRMEARRARRCRRTGGSSPSSPTIGTSRTWCSTPRPRAPSTSTCVIAASRTASPSAAAASRRPCASAWRPTAPIVRRPSVGFSSSPAVSDDGRFVAFVSNCTNLVPGDTNGKTDVFVRDTCRSNGVVVPGARRRPSA